MLCTKRRNNSWRRAREHRPDPRPTHLFLDAKGGITLIKVSEPARGSLSPGGVCLDSNCLFLCNALALALSARPLVHARNHNFMLGNPGTGPQMSPVVVLPRTFWFTRALSLLPTPDLPTALTHVTLHRDRRIGYDVLRPERPCTSFLCGTGSECSFVAAVRTCVCFNVPLPVEHHPTTHCCSLLPRPVFTINVYEYTLTLLPGCAQ